MRGFVAVTDPGWYERLARTPGPKDANFWRPSARAVRLEIGAPFLFKLKAPYNAIAGFGYFAERRVRQAQVLLDVIPRVRDIRRTGSAAVDLCGLAVGRYNAYYERGLHSWDWSAPGLVASEAGLRVGGLRGGPPSNDMVIAARPELYEQIDRMLQDLGADSDG